MKKQKVLILITLSAIALLFLTEINSVLIDSFILVYLLFALIWIVMLIILLSTRKKVLAKQLFWLSIVILVCNSLTFPIISSQSKKKRQDANILISKIENYNIENEHLPKDLNTIENVSKKETMYWVGVIPKKIKYKLNNNHFELIYGNDKFYSDRKIWYLDD